MAEHSAYQKYFDLMVEQQELLGNPNFTGEDAWYEPLLKELNPEEDVYSVTVQKDKLKNNWLLEREMWLPNAFPLILFLSAAIMSITIGVTYSSVRNLKMKIKKEMEKSS